MNTGRVRSVIIGPSFWTLWSAFSVGIIGTLLTPVLLFLLPLGEWLGVLAIPLAMVVTLAGYGLVSTWVALFPPLYVLKAATWCSGPGAYCIPPTLSDYFVGALPLTLLLGTSGYLLGKTVTWRDDDLGDDRDDDGGNDDNDD